METGRPAVEQVISASQAKRGFSQILVRVRREHRYLVTSQGVPVARILPVARRTRRDPGARAALLNRLQRQRAADLSWTRDELYEDEA